MDFEWDETKSEACFVQRGFDFAYGVFVVVYTTRTHAIRIISARKANTREVKQYENGSTEN
jgi:uncharacterized DUF497 family protein